jgi:hypothetical protein
MGDYDFNPGILLGGAAMLVSILAALAALYLRAVNRTRQRLNNTATPQERAVLPWLTPLLLPVLITICLGIVAELCQAIAEKRWPKPTLAVMLMTLVFWLRIRKGTTRALRKEEQ